jgi:hypothetical protein
MLVWILVSVIPIALLGSVLGTSVGGSRRSAGAQEAQSSSSAVKDRDCPYVIPKPDSLGSPRRQLSQLPSDSNAAGAVGDLSVQGP